MQNNSGLLQYNSYKGIFLCLAYRRELNHFRTHRKIFGDLKFFVCQKENRFAADALFASIKGGKDFEPLGTVLLTYFMSFFAKNLEVTKFIIKNSFH